ncbi:MAG TPA: hypothetical protein VFJ70_18120 [Burkholderiales bacterium]|nr:hypothetical protein [Burkholderiales bacterium]
MKNSSLFGAAALAALLALPAAAQQMKTVDGLVVNFGMIPAEQAMRAEGHRDAHPDKFPSGSQHVLITLADEKTGRRIGDAEVVVQIIDPKGKAVTKPLLHTSAAGMPDYSELFVFDWSGSYTLRVNITPAKGAKPVKASFTVHHSL